MHWRRKWQPTPVFLPGESQGRGSLVGCRLWGRTESDTTDETASAAAAATDVSTVLQEARRGQQRAEKPSDRGQRKQAKRKNL